VKRLTICIFFISIAFVVSAEAQKGDEWKQEKIPAEMLKKDLDFLVTSLEEIHPDLYARFNRIRFHLEKKKVTDGIKGPMTSLEFYKRIAPMVARLRDGHTAVMFPTRPLAEYVRRGGKIFPFDVDCRGGKVVIRKSFSPSRKIGAGASVLSINGIPAEKLVNQYISFLSPRKEEFRWILAGDLFSVYLYLIQDFDSGFHIRFRDKGGTGIRDVKLEGQTLQNINRMRKAGSPDMKMKFNFRYYEKEKAGMMAIDSFSGSGNYYEFLRDSFRQLKEKKGETLIIDLRKNSGGDSRLGEALMGYLSVEPVDLVSKTRIKVSRQVKNMFRERMKKADRSKLSPEALRYLDKIMKTGTGKILELFPRERGRTQKSLRFGGKIYLLTGIRTFSSAVLFAASFKDHGLGTVAGVETGAPASHFGEIYSFTLPNSKLGVKASYKYFIRPNGNTGPNGVIPDIKVPEDDALEMVLSRIRKGEN